MDKIQETQTYITVKDHKENFLHSISCRLINPSKTDIRKIRKAILHKSNMQLVSSIKVNQWNNSHSVINWFKNIPEMKLCIFIVSDIENFCPSISLELFYKALQFAKSLCNITDERLVSLCKREKHYF